VLVLVLAEPLVEVGPEVALVELEVALVDLEACFDPVAEGSLEDERGEHQVEDVQ